MKKMRGSLTIFFSLVMTVMVSCISVLIVSAKVSAGRMQAANSVDQCVESLFAHYDRHLADRFGLYFLYTGAPDAGRCLKAVENEMKYLLEPNRGRSLFGAKNLLSLKQDGGAVEGYTLATDGYGAPFYEQAVQEIKDSGGIYALQSVREKMAGTAETEHAGKKLRKETRSGSYAEIRRESRAAGEEAAAAEAEGGKTSGQAAAEQVPDSFVNPLPILEQLKKLSILNAVLPSSRSVSEKEAEKGSLLSGRSLSHGIGVIRLGSSSSTDDLLFKGYIYEHFGHFTEPETGSVLAYPLEYILEGRRSDRQNLTAVVRKLLLTREGANLLCLYTDPRMSLELSEIAMLIACSMMIPEAEPLVKLVLAAGWAYAESLVDVRALLEGKRIPLTKTSLTWQTDALSLGRSGGSLAGLTRDVRGGVTYHDYLGFFLLACNNHRNLVMRTMDMTEAAMRADGRPDFRLDACFDALSFSIRIRSENLVTFPVEKTLSYRDL